MPTARKKEDVALSVIERIMNSPVPNAGELKHPVQVKKRAHGQVILSDINSSTVVDVTAWGSREFVNYFAKSYQIETGGNYRKSYRADSSVFLKMFAFMKSNGLEPKQWTKNAIDWGFKRRDFIIKKRGAFTPLEILSMINYFYQEEAIPQAVTGTIVRVMGDTSLFDEINQAMNEGKQRQVFVDFGIPVGATYMVKIADLDLRSVEQAIGGMLASLASGGLKDNEKVGKIFMASVVGSPYPEGFVLLNWREVYEKELSPFQSESWYQSTDYRCQYLPKYNALLGVPEDIVAQSD